MNDGPHAGHNDPFFTQPTRPPMRGAQRYDVLRRAEAAAKSTTIESPNEHTATPTNPAGAADNASNHEDLFTMTITATSNQGGSMDNGENDEQFLLNVLFKPTEKRLRLSPELSQLLLAHIGEILKEIEREESKEKS